MGTQQEYYDQLYNQGKPSVEKQIADRKQRTEDNIGLYNSTIDQHAQAGIAGYQQSIEQAPLDALEQKEDNALREAINRKIVSENMANMGITDSGLNRTQQTALTLQRGNADAEVDKKTKEYVNQLQMAIDGVLLEAETKKADYANTQRNADEEYFDQIWANLENSAREGAATMYAADQEAEATIEAAKIKAQQEAEAAQLKAVQQADDNIRSYIAKRMADGVSYDVAAMEAYTVYGTGDEATDGYARNYTIAYQKAINMGYDDSYASIIADNYAKTENWNIAVTSAAASEVSNANADLSKMSNWDDSTRYIFHNMVDIFDTDAKDQGNAKEWDENKWKTRVKNMVDIAGERVKTEYPSLSENAKQYATAKAVVTTLAPVLPDLDNDYAIVALEKQFPSDIVDAVLADMGLEIV